MAGCHSLDIKAVGRSPGKCHECYVKEMHGWLSAGLRLAGEGRHWQSRPAKLGYHQMPAIGRKLQRICLHATCLLHRHWPFGHPCKFRHHWSCNTSKDSRKGVRSEITTHTFRTSPWEGFSDLVAHPYLKLTRLIISSSQLPTCLCRIFASSKLLEKNI